MIRTEMLKDKRRTSISNIENVNKKPKPKHQNPVDHSRKLNEALTMRSKISIDQMAQMMLDDAKFFTGPLGEIKSVYDRVRSSELWFDFAEKDRDMMQYEREFVKRQQKQNAKINAAKSFEKPSTKCEDFDQTTKYESGSGDKAFQSTQLVRRQSFKQLPFPIVRMNSQPPQHKIEETTKPKPVIRSQILSSNETVRTDRKQIDAECSKPEKQFVPMSTQTSPHKNPVIPNPVEQKIEQPASHVQPTSKPQPPPTPVADKSGRRSNNAVRPSSTSGKAGGATTTKATRGPDMFSSWGMDEDTKEPRGDLPPCGLANINILPNSKTRNSASTQAFKTPGCKSKREPCSSASVDSCNLASRAFLRFDKWTFGRDETDEHQEFAPTVEGSRGDDLSMRTAVSKSHSDTTLITKVALDNAKLNLADGGGEGMGVLMTSESEYTDIQGVNYTPRTHESGHSTPPNPCVDCEDCSRVVNLSSHTSALQCASGCSVEFSGAETYHSVDRVTSSSVRVERVASEGWKTSSEENEENLTPACPVASRECTATSASDNESDWLLMNTYSKNTGGGDDDPKGYYARILRRYADPVVPPPYPYPAREETKRYINKIMGEANKKYAQQQTRLTHIREANQVAFYRNRNERLARQQQVSRPYNLRKTTTQPPVSHLLRNKHNVGLGKSKKELQEERGFLQLPIIECAFRGTTDAQQPPFS